MKTTDLEGLLTVVEAVREEMCPEVSSDLLREVVMIEQRSADKAAALSALRQLVESALRPEVP